MKIIAKDNLDRDYVDEYIIAESIISEDFANHMAKSLNELTGDHATWYYQAVKDDYQLYKFEP